MSQQSTKSEGRRRRKKDLGKRIPSISAWAAIAVGLFAIVIAVGAQLQGLGFGLSWIAFVASMIGIGLDMVQGKKPRLSAAGLVAGLVSIGLCAFVFRQSLITTSESAPDGRKIDLQLGGKDDKSQRPKLSTHVGIDELGNTGDRNRLKVDDDDLVTIPEVPIDNLGTKEFQGDPMLNRFGVATVDKRDDLTAIKVLQDGGAVLKQELLPSDSDKTDHDAVVEVDYLKAKATDSVFRNHSASLAKLPNLRVLNLTSGTVTEAGFSAFTGGETLSEISLPTGSDAMAGQLTRFSNLRRVYFFRRGTLTDQGLGSLAKLPELERLDLGVGSNDQRGISDEGLLKLGSLKRLKHLIAPTTNISGTGLVVLAEFAELQVLDLSNSKIDDEALNTIGRVKTLQSLKLRKTPVEGPGLKSLGQCKQLAVLNLSDLPRFHSQELKHLESLPALTELSLSGTRLDHSAVAVLGKLKGLTRLDLSDCGVSDDGIQAIKEALPKCQVESIALFR